MSMLVESRRLRIPVVEGPNHIGTAWVPALLYGRSAAVHPKHQDRGMWTVSLLPSCEALYHFDNEAEAGQFARDLIIAADRRGVRLDFDRGWRCPAKTREFLIGWCSGWRSRHLLYIQKSEGAALDQGVLFTPSGRKIL